MGRRSSDLEHDSSEDAKKSKGIPVKTFSVKNLKALRSPPKDKSVKSETVVNKSGQSKPWLRVTNEEIWTPN